METSINELRNGNQNKFQLTIDVRRVRRNVIGNIIDQLHGWMPPRVPAFVLVLMSSSNDVSRLKTGSKQHLSTLIQKATYRRCLGNGTVYRQEMSCR
jgi:hypothetical protein